MKKNSIFCILLASLALVTSCKKDVEFVNFDAVIDHPSKVYIDENRYPCWNEGDEVKINGTAYGLENITGSSALITNVAQSNDYYAIYPVSIAQGTVGASTTVTLPEVQKYKTFGNNHQQRVEIPMGAHTAHNNTGQNSLQFKNLCSVVRVKITNNNNATATAGTAAYYANNIANNREMQILKITIEAQNTLLSGTGTATIEGDGESDHIAITSGKKRVSLRCNNSTTPMKTLQVGDDAEFDIVLPEFGSAGEKVTGDTITITIKTATGMKSFTTQNPVYLGHNSIVRNEFSVTSLDPLPAELKGGSQFHDLIHQNFTVSNITKIQFVCNDNTNTGTELQNTYSGSKIYGNMSGNTLVVSTPAPIMYANSSCVDMFRGLTSLQEIEFGDNFNTENVTSIYGMFQYSGITNLEDLDLEHFNTDGVTNMGNLFYGCSQLGTGNQTITFPSSFNTEHVTLMDHMFYNCSSLTSLSFPDNFNTANVWTMQAMFSRCSTLTSLNLSTFNTANVTTMYDMFADCINLTTINCGSGSNVIDLNTSSVTTMKGMFRGCSHLTSLKFGNNYNTSSVTTMEGMFYGCQRLTSLEFGNNFNTSSVVSMKNMFNNCKALWDLNLSNFVTTNVTTMEGMFTSCQQMGKTYDVQGILDLSNFTIGSTTNITNMCNGLASGRGTFDGITYYCPIICSEAVENSMSSSATNINLSKVRFYRTRGAVGSK
ncbi:MAG: BspA family leucine-rich repeat surface protein [Bacteroidales bacterium]|nr:BspA family leucine-rich repeat surface protein [Bacteroidales bacterium]